MKNIVKIIIATVGIALIFTACQKEGDLPFYKEGTGSVVLTGSAATVAAAIADADKTALTVNWTWPDYATDSVNQKFIVQIAPAGMNFEKPVTRVLKGIQSTSFTAKELNTIVFGFGEVSAPFSLDMRIISSYANNNEQYQSCLLYTSDAADEEDSVDLGGRRIIKKKKKKKKHIKKKK